MLCQLLKGDTKGRKDMKITLSFMPALDVQMDGLYTVTPVSVSARPFTYHRSTAAWAFRWNISDFSYYSAKLMGI